MSYQDIQVQKRWTVKCRECDHIEFMADSAGEAENYAKHHICEDIGDENPRPYDSHTLVICEITVVGRYI